MIKVILFQIVKFHFGHEKGLILLLCLLFRLLFSLFFKKSGRISSFMNLPLLRRNQFFSHPSFLQFLNRLSMVCYLFKRLFSQQGIQRFFSFIIPHIIHLFEHSMCDIYFFRDILPFFIVYFLFKLRRALFIQFLHKFSTIFFSFLYYLLLAHNGLFYLSFKPIFLNNLFDLHFFVFK